MNTLYSKITNGILEPMQTDVHFEHFQIIGDFSGTSESLSDVDVLVVFNDSRDAQETINIVSKWTDRIRDIAGCTVVSDSYFLPLVVGEKSASDILHLILFHSLSALLLSPYSSLLIDEPQVATPTGMSKKGLSQIMAVQDLVKFWCMTRFNELKSEYHNCLISMQKRTVIKWLKPLSQINDKHIRDIVWCIERSWNEYR